MAECARCAQDWAQQQQGAAWLAVLKAERLELPSGLAARILARIPARLPVSSAQIPAQIPERIPQRIQARTAAEPGAAVPVMAPAFPAAPPLRAHAGLAMPLVWSPADRIGEWFQGWFGRWLGEPRLAMTAAMAFFSIALTLNLLGVRLDEVHARDLRLQTLRRGYFTASARTEQFYDNLRVVHVMESGVKDLRDARENSGEDRRKNEPRPADGGSSRWEQGVAGKDLVAGGGLEAAPGLHVPAIEDRAEVRS